MICKVCGREIHSERANFCEYCGASLQENRSSGYEAEHRTSHYEYGQMRQMAETGNPAQEKEEPVSFKNWMLTLLIPLIPLVGSMIYLVMLFIWSFGSTGSRSKRNWARATLIMMLISMVLVGILFGSLFMQVIEGVMSENMNMLIIKVFS